MWASLVPGWWAAHAASSSDSSIAAREKLSPPSMGIQYGLFWRCRRIWRLLTGQRGGVSLTCGYLAGHALAAGPGFLLPFWIAMPCNFVAASSSIKSQVAACANFFAPRHRVWPMAAAQEQLSPHPELSLLCSATKTEPWSDQDGLRNWPVRLVRDKLACHRTMTSDA